jgi:outer membrane protein W
MRRVILCVAVVTALCISSVQAQFKQEKGDFCLEVQFRPFTGAPIGSEGHFSTSILNTGGVLARFFATDKFELNAGLTLGIGSRKTITDVPAGSDASLRAVETVTKGPIFGLGLGANYHLKGTERISPFIGLGLGFGIASSTETVTNRLFNPNNSSYDKRSAFFFNFNVVTGFDFYVVKGLYLGAGIGLGFTLEKEGKGISETKTGTTIDKTETTGGTSFDFGFGIQPAIRLGWKF